MGKQKTTKKATKITKKTAKNKPDSHVTPIDDEADNEMLLQIPVKLKKPRDNVGDGWRDHRNIPPAPPPAFDDSINRLGEGHSVTKYGRVPRKVHRTVNFKNTYRWTSVNDLSSEDCKNWKNVGSKNTHYAGKYYDYCKTQLRKQSSSVVRKRKVHRIRRKKKFYGPSYMWLLGESKRL